MKKNVSLIKKGDLVAAAMFLLVAAPAFIAGDVFSYLIAPDEGETGVLQYVFAVFIALLMAVTGLCVKALMNATEYLSSSQSDIFAVMETIPVMMAYIGEDQKYRYCNKAYCEHMGFAAEAMIGKTIEEFQGKKFFESIKKRLDKAFAGETVEFSHVVTLKNERKLHVKVMYYPDKRADGSVRGIFAILSDVTEMEHAQKQLEEEQRRNRYVVESTDTIVISLDPDGLIKMLNKSFQKLSGYSEEELMGKNFWKVFHPRGKDDPVVKGLRFISDNGKRMVENYVMPLKAKDGKVHMISWSTGNILDEDGNAKEYIGVGHDITGEREKANREKEHHKMRALALMSGGLAHEINNALQPILGMTDVLKIKLEKSADEKVYENIETLHKNALHARKIVEQVLNFSRRDPKESVMYQAADVLAEAIDHCRAVLPDTVTLQTSGFEGDSKLTEDLPIKVDETGMKQVITNLVNNAADAMDNKGTIKVSLDPMDIQQGDQNADQLKPGSYALIAVADDGDGMDEETKNSLFEPFFTTKPVGEGTGLGLATVYGIVNEWNGTIKVESKKGEGSTFKIYIPKSEEEVASLKPNDDVIIYVPHVGKR